MRPLKATPCWRLGAVTLSAALCGTIALPALAQTAPISSVNTTPGAIGDTTACVGATNLGSNPTANLVRTFNMSGLPSAEDIESLRIGLIATHSWRGDINVEIESPDGAIATVIASDTSFNPADYNVLLTDDTVPIVNTSGGGVDHTTPDDTTVPPYENPVGTSGSLAGLFTTGATMNDEWTLRICDDYFGADDGTLTRAELNFLPKAGDLELAGSVTDPFPTAGSTETVTYTVSNSGPNTQSGITVTLNLPASVTPADVTPSAGGSFASGVWTAPDLTAGGSATLTIDYDVGTISQTLTADITTASFPDPDSTVGNNETSEDDYASVTVSPQPATPPTPPNLVCSFNPEYRLAWDNSDPDYDWPIGTATTPVLFQSYDVNALPDPAFPGPQPTIDMSLQLVDSTNSLRDTGAGAGPKTPVTQSTYNGGFTGQDSVFFVVDFPSNSSSIDMTMLLGIPAEGVEGVQFSISDIDTGSFVDRITVTGKANGTAISPPIMTPGAEVLLAGPGRVIGKVGPNVPPNSGDGNVVVTFDEPVDEINFVYDNDPSAPADPAPQAIALQNLKICRRNLPEITAVKTVEISDAAGNGEFATPGNQMVYKITVTNSPTAQSDAKNIDLVDTLPASVRFISAGTNGNFTTGAFSGLPLANTDCASSACTISFLNGTLPIDTVGEVQVVTMIK